MRRPLLVLLAVLLTAAGLSVAAPTAHAAGGVFPVGASANDAEQGSRSTSLSSSDLELIYDSTRQTVGLRFTGVTIPPGATISKAYVQFTAAKSASTVVRLTVHGQADVDPGVFTTSSTSVSSRPKTAASVPWRPASWSRGSRGPAQQTPDLATVVQEIVDLPGWESGSALVVIISGSDTAQRLARSYDGRPADAPALHVEWTTSAPLPPPPPQPAICSDVQDNDGDGLTDFGADPGCATATDTDETDTDETDPDVPPPAVCSDGLDNDGDGVTDFGADPGCTATTDTDETDPVVPPRPPSGGGPTPADYGFPDCFAGRDVARPFPAGTVLASRYRQPSPPDDTTYDLTGVFSTAQPSAQYPFSFGTSKDNRGAGDRTCLVGGELRDTFGNPPPRTWEYYHDKINASCVKAAAYSWYQILDQVCRGIEDGFRTQEPGVNANTARFAISDTYLGNVFDDCLENDYTVGGVVLDSLWESCFTGVSERPSSDRCWKTPPGEQLILDHLLLGLRPMRHNDGTTRYGVLFKWEACAQETANQLVLKCSTFLVPATRSYGRLSGMDFPAGTTVDDTACPGEPTTIVWLGGGTGYPGDLRGLPIRVVTDRSYWDAKVADWKSRHGM